MSKERNRMTVRIKQAFMGVVNGTPKVLGLGYDDKVYYYTSDGWKKVRVTP